MSADKITPNDIKNKLADIQGEATTTVEGAKSQIIAIAGGVAILLIVIAFLLGRPRLRQGRRRIRRRRCRRMAHRPGAHIE